MKCLLIDGFNLAFRSFYGMPELSTQEGFPTGALHGWVRTLWMIQDKQLPDRSTVFFDLGGAARQTELLPEYKANRSEMPEALRQQIPYMKKISEAMGMPTVESEGVEADDLIASTARALAKEGHEVLIVSADKDLGQLVTDQIKQLLPPPTANPRLGWREMDATAVEEKFGVRPDQIPDYLALVGDASDNIPGVPGVGPKTATKWIQQYGDIDGMKKAAADGSLKPPRFQEIISSMHEALERNLMMVTLECDFDPATIKEGTVQLKELIELLESFDMLKAASDAHERYARLL